MTPRKRNDSSEEPRSPAQQFLSELRPEEFAGRNERRFETAVVLKIIECYRDAKSLRQQLYDRTGEGPTLHDFWEICHDRFPVWLFARRFPKVDSDLTVGNLMGRFEKTKVYKALLDTLEEFPAVNNLPVGLVFAWPRLQHKTSRTREGVGVVLHNWDMSSEASEIRVRVEAVDWRITPLGDLLEGCKQAGYFQH